MNVTREKCQQQDENQLMKGVGVMSKEKEPHEKLADKELDLKAAQEVHYNDDFKKADNVAKAENQQNESKSEKSDDK